MCVCCFGSVPTYWFLSPVWSLPVPNASLLCAAAVQEGGLQDGAVLQTGEAPRGELADVAAQKQQLAAEKTALVKEKALSGNTHT